MGAVLPGLITASAASVQLQWNPSPDPSVVAYQLYYGTGTHTYTRIIAAGSATLATVNDLTESITYYFSATSLNADGLESDFSGELVYRVPGTVPSGACVISLSGLEQDYEGTPKAVSATTTPVDLSYSLTYSGLTTPPTEPGSYVVMAVSRDSRCDTQTTEILTINPARASVQLGNLQQDYDGNPKPATVVTDPPDLPVIITYSGSPDPPTEVGVYAVEATILDNHYAGSTAGLLIVSKSQGQIYLAALDKVYDGTPPEVWTLTSPPGLRLMLTYNGLPDPPTDAGTYRLDATIDDPDYFGISTVNVTIEKAEVTIELGNLTQVYDGTPRPVSVSTYGVGVEMDLTYDGSPDQPTGAGTYDVKATVVNETNYWGSATGTLIVAKASALVSFNNLQQTADGTTKSVSVSTEPPGLYVLLKYLGHPGAPSAPGAYTVNGIVYDPNYQGSATTSFMIDSPGPLPSTIGSTEFPPTAARPPLVLSWPGLSGSVTVWSSTNLTDWIVVTNVARPSGSFMVQPGPGAKFFKATSQGSGGGERVPIVLR